MSWWVRPDGAPDSRPRGNDFPNDLPSSVSQGHTGPRVAPTLATTHSEAGNGSTPPPWTQRTTPCRARCGAHAPSRGRSVTSESSVPRGRCRVTTWSGVMTSCRRRPRTLGVASLGGRGATGTPPAGNCCSRTRLGSSVGTWARTLKTRKTRNVK